MEGSIGEAIELTVDSDAGTQLNTAARNASDGRSSTSLNEHPSTSIVRKLDFTYSRWKTHLEKSLKILSSLDVAICTVCSRAVHHEKDLVCVCPHADCQAKSHLQCLSKHLLDGSLSETAIVPISGPCPSCLQETRWDDIVRELTLRLRGDKEIKELYKRSRQKKGTSDVKIPTSMNDQGPVADTEDIEAQATTEALECVFEENPRDMVGKERRAKKVALDGFIDLDDIQAPASDVVGKVRPPKRSAQASSAMGQPLTEPNSLSSSPFVDIEEYDVRKWKQAVEEVVGSSPPPTPAKKKLKTVAIEDTPARPPRTSKIKQFKCPLSRPEVITSSKNGEVGAKQADNKTGWSDVESSE